MKLLLQEGSRSSKGSLQQVKDKFGFKNVTHNLMSSLNATSNFLRVVTEAFVCLLVCIFHCTHEKQFIPN
jgi:hypothetical protein